MKDIMTDCSMTESRKVATEKWHEYAKAARSFRNPVYNDLQKIYNQVKNGQKVIDIGKVIAKAGLIKGNPRLAIAPVGIKRVYCSYAQNGDVNFKPDNDWRRKSVIRDVNIRTCLPSWVDPSNKWNKKNLEAPVPPVPPRFMPKILTDDYYILWEVDEWKMVPPTDPYLLRRITKNMFVVLAGWDLTEIEKSAMAGRMS